MEETYDVERFLVAQEHVYDHAFNEIKQGHKSSHWMWFIFPQILGFGKSSMSIKYSISSRQEAIYYLEHPVLGPRLVEISNQVLAINGKTAFEIFGHPDDRKLKSCMTLFSQVSEKNDVFQKVLTKHFDGFPDKKTLRILEVISSKR